MSEIINDNEMYAEIVTDLINRYDWEEKKAMQWANEHGASIVSTMWDAYSQYMEQEVNK